MSIIRGPKPESNWYQLDKRISQDRRLSWQARGLLIYLLGKPDHWQVSVEALKKETADSIKPTSRDGIYSILKELESAGYVSRKPARDDHGKMNGFDYVVSETPLPAKPYPVQPLTANTTQASNELEQGLIDNNSCDQQADRVPYAAIFQAYAECLPELPQLKIKDDARRKAIKMICTMDDRFYKVESWQKFFKYVRASQFLMNMTGIGFDWLLKKANFKKVLEGNYHEAKKHA